MKFIPLRDFDIVTSALNFDTPDCHVTGGCDLYTTKAAGSDKKLYKNIDKSLESQHAALLKLGASLSPPQRQELAMSQNLSRSSPFGNLAEISSRRTFAYLIATLNASHPDYDFSHVLRPGDFKRERNLRKLMSNLDNTLNNVRPPSSLMCADGSLPRSYGSAAGAGGLLMADSGASTSPLWGPQMWALIDKEMTLSDCTVFSYQPADVPFDEEEGAIWAMHYFFFNKALKRVAYLYVRAVPVMSHSPRLRPRARIAGAGASGRFSPSLSATRHRSGGGLGLGVGGGGSTGADKRARFWLGDRYADRIVDLDDDDDDYMDDGMLWNRGPDGDVDDYAGYDGGDYEDEDEDEDDGYSVDEADDDEEESSEGDKEADAEQDKKGPVRAVSEDIASRMDLDL